MAVPLNPRAYSQICSLLRYFGWHEVLRELEFLAGEMIEIDREALIPSPATPDWEAMRAKISEATAIAFKIHQETAPL